MAIHKCIESLEENPIEVFLKVTELIIKLIDNILRYPSDPKYRKLRLENKLVSTVIMPTIGAMECLFELGFQEDDDALLLPPEKTSIEKLTQFKSQLTSRRIKYLSTSSRPTITATKVDDPSVKPQTSSLSSQEISSPPVPSTSAASSSSHSSSENRFLSKLHSYSTMVLQYEEKAVKEKVLSVVPLDNINAKVQHCMRENQKQAIKSSEPISEDSLQEAIFIQELMNWFKNDLFEWVDSPKCLRCQSDTNFLEMSTDPLEISQAERVEVYKCGNCSARVLFLRYNLVTTLLETRKGRCGEWANVFTAVCRALGWEARFISDQTDHAWTEVYFKSEKRWVHCDPCECVLDKPLLYEKGWGKKLTYIIAFSCEGVQDVTWRYSANHKEVLARRNLCSESQLVQTICELSRNRQANLTAKRKKELAKRTLEELIHLMQPAAEHEGDGEGRQSGSLSWRLSRQEISLAQANTPEPFVWTPTEKEVKEKKMVISYCTATDEYKRLGGETIKGWNCGVFHTNSVFRKEEKDWKFAYLCRTEKSVEGKVQWRIDLEDYDLRVDSLEVQCPGTTFHSGKISWSLCAGDKCVRVNQGKATTSDLKGSTTLTLTVTLTGGEGSQAWQHAQLLRQPLGALEPAFLLTVTLTTS